MECLLITPLIFLKVKPSSEKLMRSYELHFLSVCVCVCVLVSCLAFSKQLELHVLQAYTNYIFIMPLSFII